MGKKLMGIAVAAIMLFGILGLVGCDNTSLVDYKMAGRTAIEAYAQEREDDLWEDDWDIVCGIVESGKQAVDASKNRAGVDTAVSGAKEEMDALEVQYGGKGIPLNNKLRLEILNLYSSWALSEYGENYAHKDKEYFIYYGQYNGFYVFRFSGWGFSHSEEYIDGLNFSRPVFGYIYIISENYGGVLKEAYEEEYLTRCELEEIHRVHVEIHADYFARHMQQA